MTNRKIDRTVDLMVVAIHLVAAAGVFLAERQLVKAINSLKGQVRFTIICPMTKER